MPVIPLTQGKEAIVCDCHYDLVKDFKWFYMSGAGGYAARTLNYNDESGLPKTKTILMHRILTGAEGKSQVDHKDMNKLNNRCDNLRVCSRSDNYANQKAYKTNTSGYKGVNYMPRIKKWVARVQVEGERIYLGVFSTKRDAAEAYNKAALQHFGEFARLNEIGVK